MYSKKRITNLILDTFDNLSIPTPYNIGLEIGRSLGKGLIDYLQECGFIVKPAIIEILMELCFPAVTNEHVDFKSIREKCYTEFLSGVVKSKITK